MTKQIKLKIDSGSRSLDNAVWLTIFSVMVSFPMAWITHVVWIIRVLASDKGATTGQIAVGAIGAFMPPFGVVHGYLVWFGMGSL